MEKLKSIAKRLWLDERGIGTLEIIMLVAVVVIIAVAFRKWIMKWVGDLFNTTNQNMDNFNLDSPTNLTPSQNAS
jgi:Flp pilus assembly pilin Flp